MKQLEAKPRSLSQAHFVLPILFVTKLAFERAVLNGNLAFSLVVLSTKKQYSSFSKKLLVFQKTCFKVSALKTFKIFTLKLADLLKRIYIQNSQYCFLEEPMLFLLPLKWNLCELAFSCVNTKTNSHFAVKFAVNPFAFNIHFLSI